MDIGRAWAFIDVTAPDFARAASFWATVTGATPSQPRGDSGQFLTLEPGDGVAWLKMQRVGGRSGLHIDLDVTNREASLEALLTAGAHLRGSWQGVPALLSPAGHLFCITVLTGDEPPAPAGVGGGRAVCLELPTSRYADETAFWVAATGAAASDGPVPDSTLLAPAGWSFDLVLRAVPEVPTDPSTPPRGMVVLSPATDRASAAAAHRRAGAEVIEELGRWLVLRDPVGRRYALT